MTVSKKPSESGTIEGEALVTCLLVLGSLLRVHLRVQIIRSPTLTSDHGMSDSRFTASYSQFIENELLFFLHIHAMSASHCPGARLSCAESLPR